MRTAGLLLALVTASPAAAGDWNFRVLLDGREIGRHRYTMTASGEESKLLSSAAFDVRFLRISAYRYDHQATESWRSGCLQSLDASTTTNGRRVAVSARFQAGRLRVEGPGGRREHEGCIRTFAYWDPQILTAERLLNSATGELVAVQVTPAGSEDVVVRGRKRLASRHRIRGRDLEIDLWYADGQWIALEALTAGGRRLRYELT